MVLLGWGLMTLGAFVRASESGLGCPDWPACHGQLVVGGHHALIEEVHRWVAMILIIGIVGLALNVFRLHRHDRRLTHLAVWALVLLVLQAVLGGVTVLLRNVSWTVVAHYGAAALLVATLTLLTVRLAIETSERAPWSPLSRLTAAVSLMGLGLLLAGSTVANTDSHTACGRYLLSCNRSLLPALNHHVVINLVHRTWALATLVLLLWLLLRSRREAPGAFPTVRRVAILASGVYLVQVGLGLAVLGFGENTTFEVLHSSVAALTWIALIALLALSRLPQAGLSPREAAQL